MNVSTGVCVCVRAHRPHVCAHTHIPWPRPQSCGTPAATGTPHTKVFVLASALGKWLNPGPAPEKYKMNLEHLGARKQGSAHSTMGVRARDTEGSWKGCSLAKREAV